VREDHLVPGIQSFFSEHVFGPRRKELVEQDLKRLRSRQDETATTRIKALERSIAQREARQARLLHSLETNDDPDGPMFRQIRDRMNELEAERLQQLRQKNREVDPSTLELLDALHTLTTA
jgi:hypothetical protein